MLAFPLLKIANFHAWWRASDSWVTHVKWALPRDAQRDAPSAEEASQDRSILQLFSGKRAEIPLPYGNIRAMKDALMLTH